MPSLIWNSGASISCTQTMNRFDITLNGSAYWDGGSGGTDIRYVLYIDGERWSTLTNNQYTVYIAWLTPGATQFTIHIDAEKVYYGTTYTADGPSKVQQVTNYVEWNSGSHLLVFRNTLYPEYVTVGDVGGGAHTINGGSGTIDYIYNIYYDPTASQPSKQYLNSDYHTNFNIVNELNGYDNEIAISMIGRLTYNGTWFYTTELPKVTYFTYSGKTVKRYNGSTWQNCEVFYYVGNGTGNYGTNNNWQRVQPMVYNGTRFVQNIYE